MKLRFLIPPMLAALVVGCRAPLELTKPKAAPPAAIAANNTTPPWKKSQPAIQPEAEASTAIASAAPLPPWKKPKTASEPGSFEPRPPTIEDSTVVAAALQPVESEPLPLQTTDNGQFLAAATSPSLQLDLIQSLETSLLQNPDLQALRRNEGVSVAALDVARTYPFNPFVQVQATPWQDAKSGGPGTVYHYVLLMQQIQLGHQQRFREENALAALASVRWNIVQAELLNVAQTERLYFTALYLRGVRNLLRANAELNDQLLAVLEKRLEAGEAAAVDVAIVRLDNRAAWQQTRLAEANYQNALLDLQRQLNLPIATPLEPVGDLAGWEWLSPTPAENVPSPDAQNVCNLIDTTSVAATLVASRPDVLAARADLAAARANVGLANGARRPDLQIGPYYQRTESGTSYLGFRAQTDIPVLNNGMPLVRQREAEAAQRQAVWQQLQRRAQLEAEGAIARYERARRALADSGTFSDSLPMELQRLEQQFRANEVDFLRVVTARTSLIQSRRAQLDLMNETAQAAATVTAATGLPPEMIVRLRMVEGTSSAR